MESEVKDKSTGDEDLPLVFHTACVEYYSRLRYVCMSHQTHNYAQLSGKRTSIRNHCSLPYEGNSGHSQPFSIYNFHSSEPAYATIAHTSL